MTKQCIGFACGAITGPGALITAAVGAFIGGVGGLGAGVYNANLFFKPSPSEAQAQVLANTVKERYLKTLPDTSEKNDEGNEEQPSLGG